MSTKQLTVPYSLFRGKENSILRKENNKTIWTHKIAKGERPFFNSEGCFFYRPDPLFPSSLSSLWPEKLTRVELRGRSFL